MAIWETVAFEILTFGIIASVIVCHHWTKKVTSTYWWWMGCSVAALIFMIAGQWGQHWYNLFAHWNELPEDLWERSTRLSYGLLTNMCYFFAFAMPIALIADPTRRVARAFAPTAMLAGLTVLVGIVPFGLNGSPHFNLEYIVMGNYSSLTFGEHTYHFWTQFYSMHLINMVLSIGCILTTPRYGWKGLASVGIGYGALYTQVGIISASLGMIGQNSGIGIEDFKQGNFAPVGALFPKPEIGQAMFFAFSIIGIVFIVAMVDFVLKRGKWFQYGSSKTGVWWNYWDYNNFPKDAPQKDWGKLGRFLPKIR